MRKEIKVLLGATKLGSLIFAEVDLGDKFSVSFDEVTPFVASNEYLNEVAENMLEDVDLDYKLDLLYDYDCRPSELVETYAQNTSIDELIDISLFSDSFDVHGLDDEVYFESSGCGQGDHRDSLIPINEVVSGFIHEMWDIFHLKENMGRITKKMLENMIKEYSNDLDEDKWIQNWLETVVYPNN